MLRKGVTGRRKGGAYEVNLGEKRQRPLVCFGRFGGGRAADVLFFSGLSPCRPHLHYLCLYSCPAGRGAAGAAGCDPCGDGVWPGQHVEGLRQLCDGLRPAFFSRPQRAALGKSAAQCGDARAVWTGDRPAVYGRQKIPFFRTLGGRGLLYGAVCSCCIGLYGVVFVVSGDGLSAFCGAERSGWSGGYHHKPDHCGNRIGVLAGEAVQTLDSGSISAGDSISTGSPSPMRAIPTCSICRFSFSLASWPWSYWLLYL